MEEYSKADLIWMINSRKSGYSLNKLCFRRPGLWKKSTSRLKSMVGKVSRKEKRILKYIKDRRCLYTADIYPMHRFNHILCINDIQSIHKSREGMIDILIYLNERNYPRLLTYNCITNPFMVVLNKQQQECVDLSLKKRLYINGGYETGKTTVLCNIIKRLSVITTEKTLVLVRDKTDEDIIVNKLRFTQIKIIPYAETFDLSAHGVCVLTFDQFCYHLFLYNKLSQSTIIQEDHIPKMFDTLIIDEIHKLEYPHEKILNLLIEKCNSFIAAGQLRSYWFSTLWAHAPHDHCKTLPIF